MLVNQLILPEIIQRNKSIVSMKITRVYADSNGDSMFEEIEVPLPTG